MDACAFTLCARSEILFEVIPRKDDSRMSCPIV